MVDEMFFAKLKEKKRRKELRAAQEAFFAKSDIAKAVKDFGYFDTFKIVFNDVLKDLDKDGLAKLDPSELNKRLQEWSVYKDIKALAKPGDKVGHEYMMYFDRLFDKRKYPDGTEFPGYYEPYYDNKEMAHYMFLALIGDTGFWEGKVSDKYDPSAYMTIANAVQGLGNFCCILSWPLVLDWTSIFDGSSGYVMFGRAVLKAYKQHGSSPLWEETMKRLRFYNYSVEYLGRKHPLQGTSILGGRFSYVTHSPDGKGPHEKEWNDLLDGSKCFSLYVHDYDSEYTRWYPDAKGIVPYAGILVTAVDKYILSNDEYWVTSNSKRREEIWDYIDDLNHKVSIAYRESKEREWAAKENPDE